MIYCYTHKTYHITVQEQIDCLTKEADNDTT